MTDPSPLLLHVERVAKSFGPTQAVVDATLELRPGEVRCIVGENGSGKSTLVKMLAGVHRPDAGAITIADASGSGFDSPRQALQAGIATVFQEVLVVEPRSILDNVWLGTDGLFRSAIGGSERRRRAQAVLTELMGHEVSLDLPVEALTLSERQTCCIARALVQDPQVLILDEATSALDVETRDRLFAAIRRRSAVGAAAIFISHRMDELSEIGDRFTVMRSGTTVATLGRDEATTQELVRLMTASDSLASEEVVREARDITPGEIVLRTEGLVLRPGCAPIDFELRAGELVGLAGLEGHGQDAFIKALWGMGAPGVSTDRGPITSPRQAASAGVAYVPRERRAEAIFDSKSIRENFALPTLSRDARGLLLRPAASRARLAAWSERIGIKMGDPEDLITTLSGGNQQKVIVARWLAAEPRVLLLNDPTRGVDIGTKRDLYRALVDLARGGMAVVMLSTEVDEHVELMDRVLVFREHALHRELSRAELDRQTLVSAYFGGRRPGDAPSRPVYA
jgi:ABC-type sugar transport system ATPase subunit